jgi:membrane protein implicated in regulation of membrane protease activity
MAESTVWWLLAGAAVALELVTGTFFLLMLAVGLGAGAVAAHLGLGMSSQLVAAALVGGGAVAGWQRWRKLRPPAAPASANKDVNLDIGQTVRIEHWNQDGKAVVRYRGADWTASLSTPSPDAASGQYRIIAVEGSLLIVEPS